MSVEKCWGLTVSEVIAELQEMVRDPEISHVHSGVLMAAIGHLHGLELSVSERDRLVSDSQKLATAIRLAKQATNGWACFAKRNIEHDEIARLHREIDALESATPAPTPDDRTKE